MALTSNTYLLFDGNCREVLDTYARIFGGSTVYMTMDFFTQDPADAARVAHGEMRSDVLFLQGSDGPGEMEIVRSEAYSLAIMGSDPADEAQARTYFDALAEGGHVTQALELMPWGGLYGDLTDKFGIRWCFNIQMEQGIAPIEQGVQA